MWAKKQTSQNKRKTAETGTLDQLSPGQVEGRPVHGRHVGLDADAAALPQEWTPVWGLGVGPAGLLKGL